MDYIKGIGLPLLQFNLFMPFGDQIVHFISTRKGDSNPLIPKCFSIGLNGMLDNQTVLKNRKRIAEELGFLPDSYVFASQVHGKGVAVIGEKDKGKGAFNREEYIENVDALITNKKGICLVAQAADCVPLLFFDPNKMVIAAAHAGWKGTVLKIAATVVETMVKDFNCSTEDIYVGIGPSAGPCCYEVGKEVAEQVLKSYGFSDKILNKIDQSEKFIFNLWESNRIALVEAGVNSSRIEISNHCTICNNHEFFSARKGDKGRFGAGIMLL